MTAIHVAVFCGGPQEVRQINSTAETQYVLLFIDMSNYVIYRTPLESIPTVAMTNGGISLHTARRFVVIVVRPIPFRPAYLPAIIIDRLPGPYA